MADANDTDGSVTNVQFFDGASSLSSVASAPFNLTVNLGVGSHPLTAIATDNLGASSTSAVVNVTVTTTPVIITNPIAARIPKGDLTIELQTVADGLAAPIGMAVPDDASGRMFVYDQEGRAWVVTATGRSVDAVA